VATQIEKRIAVAAIRVAFVIIIDGIYVIDDIEVIVFTIIGLSGGIVVSNAITITIANDIEITVTNTIKITVVDAGEAIIRRVAAATV
jgi:hypothetical protein